MLPLPAGGAAQEIGGAGFGGDSDALPLGAGAAAEAESGFGEQRDADDVAEYGPVAVPANAGAGGIFDQQGVLEVVRREAGEGGGADADREQEIGDRIGGPETAAVERIMPAVGDGAAVAFEAVELEVAERQAGELPRQLLLLVEGQEAGAVLKAFRRIGRDQQARSISLPTTAPKMPPMIAPPAPLSRPR